MNKELNSNGIYVGFSCTISALDSPVTFRAIFSYKFSCTYSDHDLFCLSSLVYSATLP